MITKVGAGRFDVGYRNTNAALAERVAQSQTIPPAPPVTKAVFRLN
jgi:hypothetical protein